MKNRVGIARRNRRAMYRIIEYAYQPIIGRRSSVYNYGLGLYPKHPPKLATELVELIFYRSLRKAMAFGDHSNLHSVFVVLIEELPMHRFQIFACPM